MTPPISPVRIETLVDNAAACHPDKLALVHGARRWSYAELRTEMDRRAAVLVAAGVAPGAVVTASTSASANMAITFLACCRANLTFFAPSNKLTTDELAPLIARTRTQLILTDDGTPHPAAPEIRALPLDLPGNAPAAAAEAARRSALGTVDDIAVIHMTSSTTGAAPKLVPTPHRIMTWRRLLPHWWERPADVQHILQVGFAPVRLLCEVLALGATGVYPTVIEPKRLEAEMAAHGVTVLKTIPPVLHLLAEQPEPPPPLAVRVVRYGSAPLLPAVRQAIEERYHALVVPTYSSTEGDAMLGPPAGAIPIDTIGTPYPGVEVRIVDEDGADVADGTIGELIVRSPGIMPGYLDDPDATARALRGGWLWTGDLARRDAEGLYYLAGRRGLRINVGGHKVAPEEIEAVLLQHPAVREAVVLGMPDTARGEVVRAVIVPRDHAPTVSELRHFCRARLAGYKVPRHWEFREELPRSPLGKVLRNRL